MSIRRIGTSIVHHYCRLGQKIALPNRRLLSSQHIDIQGAKKIVERHLERVTEAMNEREGWKYNIDCIHLRYRYGTAAEFAWLPGYMVKLHPERIEGGRILKRWIEQNGLSLLRIPEQIPLPIPPSHQHMTSLKVLCICEKILGVGPESLSLEHTMQLVHLIEGTGISDLKAENLVHCPDGRIAIIDTEVARNTSIRTALNWFLEKNQFDEPAKAFVKRARRALS